MSVDVIYQGLAIARNAGVRVEGAQLFIELDSPMPVATELSLQHEGHRLEGRVARVHEGVGAGVHFAPSGRLPDWIRRLQPRAVETVEIEAEPDEAEIAAAAQAPAQAAQAPAPAQAAQASAPAQAQAGASEQTPVTAPAQAAIEAAPAAPPAQDPEPAAAEPASAASPAPFEPTLEIGIPSDEDGKIEGEAEPSGAPRPGKKKKSSRKR